MYIRLEYAAKVVGRNEMPFGRDTRVVQSNTVLDRDPGPSRKEEGFEKSDPHLSVRSDGANCQLTSALVRSYYVYFWNLCCILLNSETGTPDDGTAPAPSALCTPARNAVIAWKRSPTAYTSRCRTLLHCIRVVQWRTVIYDVSTLRWSTKDFGYKTLMESIEKYNLIIWRAVVK